MREKNYWDKIPNIAAITFNPIPHLLRGCDLYILDSNCNVLTYTFLKFSAKDLHNMDCIRLLVNKSSTFKVAKSGHAVKAVLIPTSKVFKHTITVGTCGSELNLANTCLSTGTLLCLDAVTLDMPRVYSFLPMGKVDSPQKDYLWGYNGVGEEDGSTPVQGDEEDWWNS